MFHALVSEENKTSYTVSYHVRPRRIRELLSFFGCLGIIAVLILALIGLRAVIKSLIP